jgi:hypothetical protein
MTEQLNSRDLILLSAYLDGELDPREKARVEALLQSNPEAKETFESLQKTRAVLRNAPLRKVPRNFTLSAATVQQPRRPYFLIPALRFSSVLATLMAVWMFVSQLLPGMSARPLTASEPMMELQAVTGTETVRIMAVPETPQETPPVVYWGGPPAPAMGMGGGGGIAPGCPDAFCGGASDSPPANGIGGGLDLEFKSQAIPESGAGSIQINPIPTQIEPLPLEGSGPVLGVRQPEEQGKTLFTPNLSPTEPAPPPLPSTPQTPQERGMIRPVWLAGGGFAILALGLWLLSILLKRKMS